MFNLIKELTELVGPVGQEGPVLDYVEKLWQSLGLPTERTKSGTNRCWNGIGHGIGSRRH